MTAVGTDGTTPTRVYLLRHAETTDPTVFHGAESDVSLSPKGHRQAATIAGYLAGHRPNVVISSQMRRARETAQPIALAAGLVLQTELDLHERRVGALSGTRTDDPDGVWPQTVRRWNAGETGYAPPGAESFDAIRARVVPVWDRLTSVHAGRTLVIVAHGIVCKVLLLTILGGPRPLPWGRVDDIRNVAVSELTRTPEGWQAVALGVQPKVIGEHGLA